MKRLTAYVSGSVQKTGYRAKVADFARMLGLKGTVENLDDSRVKILAEGSEDKLKWFEEAININDNLIQVSSIEREYSEPKGDFSRFYKLVEKGETDSRLDTAASHLNNLIGAVNNLNDNLGRKMDTMIDLNENIGKKMDTMIDSNDNLGKKMDTMIDSNDNLGRKMDVMIDLQRETLNAQENLLEEVSESRKDLKGYLEQRFEKLESEVTEMRAALREKGIIST
jgi:acylphosphatase